VKFGKQDKGVAGLTILLSLVTMLFVIGLLVMIFALMGGELQDATDDATAIDVINDTTSSISSVTDWYDIFIVIGAMVVFDLINSNNNYSNKRIRTYGRWWCLKAELIFDF